MKDAEILLYHNHTEESNRVADFGPELDDFIVKNHYADYAHFIDELPGDVNPVIVRTEHGMKRSSEDSKSFHQEFWTDILDRGGQVETHDTHVTGTLGETEFAVIDGVEATYNERDQHLLLAGLPLEEEIDAYNIGKEEFFEYAGEAAWSGIPHWNIMTPSLEEKEEIIHEADDLDDVELALSHSGGYGLMNKIVNDELPGTGRSEIDQFSSDYDLPILPELDWHVTLPHGLDHTGVLESGTIDWLRDGQMPVKDILEADTVDYGFTPGNEIKDSWNFGTTQVAPSFANGSGAIATASSAGQLVLGYTSPEEYRQKMRENVSYVALSVNPDMLKSNAEDIYD